MLNHYMPATCANSCTTASQSRWYGCGCNNSYGCCSTCGGCNACGGSCGCSGNCSGCNTCGGSCGCSSACGCTGNCNSSQCAELTPLPQWEVLLPRVIGAGRFFRRRVNVTLCAADLPDDAEGPYTLAGVSACGPATWERVQDDNNRWVIRVTVPLLLQLRTCGGCIVNGHASITVDVPLRPGSGVQDCWRCPIMVSPRVRLVNGCGVCSNDGCFEVTLEVLIDVYMLRWEAASSMDDCNPCAPWNEAAFHRGGCRW